MFRFFFFSIIYIYIYMRLFKIELKILTVAMLNYVSFGIMIKSYKEQVKDVGS